jgi:YebC/PmpR family DNA-binding regulatory protein
MPKDNIERAIQRGSGQSGGEAFEAIVYEGYGAAGVAILVEALTDNRNRTAAEVRGAFTKHNGNLAEPGAVSWVFERHGSIMVSATEYSEDDVMTAALEGGADDVVLDGESFQIITQPGELPAVRDSLAAAGIGFEAAELAMIPKSTVKLDEADARRVLRLIEALEDSDDVQDVYANFDIPDDVLERVAG